MFLSLYMGLWFIFLAIVYVPGWTSLSPVTIFCYSIAGFLFTVKELKEIDEEENKQKPPPSKAWKIWLAILKDFRFWSMFFVIAAPHLSIWNQVNKDTIKEINSYTTLLGLGLVIIMATYKEAKKKKEDKQGKVEDIEAKDTDKEARRE